MDLMPFDELNSFKAALPQYFDSETGRIKSEQDYEDIIDEMLDLFLLAYARGVADTNESLSSNYEPSLDDVMRTVDKKVVGKTWRERMREYYDNGGTIADVVRIAETEAHRDSNAGAYETAIAAGATTKTWHCMMLPTSRETHIYLNGVQAPLDGEFYSFMGGSTMYPGEWGIAEEDVNCLCFCTFS